MIPTDVDPLLWFMHTGCEGRHYLLGNPHTVPGRLWAWCPVEATSFFVALSEIGERSTETDYWLRGYFHGAEPGPPAVYYDEPNGHTHPDYVQWKKSIAHFHATGKWEDQ